jgi:hypothetical protein
MQTWTVKMLSGDTATLNVEQVTHMTPNNHGTQIHFTSGEAIISGTPIGQLSLEFASYGSNMRAPR